MIKYLNICFISIFIGCSARHMPDNLKGRFVEYENSNKIAMRLDAITIKDKSFKLQIPEGLKNKRVVIGSAFLQILSYQNGQKIIMLYMPANKELPSVKLIDISYNDFMNTCQTADIDWQFKDIALNKHRRFGLYKPNNTGFYAIYLNVKPSQVGIFNYSISSIKLQ